MPNGCVSVKLGSLGEKMFGPKRLALPGSPLGTSSSSRPGLPTSSCWFLRLGEVSFRSVELRMILIAARGWVISGFRVQACSEANLPVAPHLLLRTPGMSFLARTATRRTPCLLRRTFASAGGQQPPRILITGSVGQIGRSPHLTQPCVLWPFVHTIIRAVSPFSQSVHLFLTVVVSRTDHHY